MREVETATASDSSRAQLILDVAKAASAHLHLPAVLEALTSSLKPFVRFDGIGVIVREGDFARVHSVHLPGVKFELSKQPIPMPSHHMAEILRTHRPYVCVDIEKQKRFASDEYFLNHGFRSYIGLPLTKQGEVIGIVDFASFEKHDYSEREVHLLQDVSEIVSIAVSNALAYEEINALKERLQAENRLLQDEVVQGSIYEEIVGSSTALKKVLASIEKVAPTDSTVLVTGETGTGKELLAHAIHRRSPRAARVLVKVNCAVLPAELIASELFGHEKGSFTGALQQRIGRFETANGGTIFLDEIGELTGEMQIALLRVLQEKEFERVGGNRTISTDVRVIAATNRNLEEEVAEGRFRMDLYYRLNVFPVHIPSLRERADDIPILVDYFVARQAARMGKRIREIERKTFDAMQQYAWPGNIRELQNVIERGVILSEGEVFRLEPGTLAPRAVPPIRAQSVGGNEKSDEKSEIEAVLMETRGRVSGPSGAAARIGIPASTLESKIKSLKINKHQFRGSV